MTRTKTIKTAAALIATAIAAASTPAMAGQLSGTLIKNVPSDVMERGTQAQARIQGPQNAFNGRLIQNAGVDNFNRTLAGADKAMQNRNLAARNTAQLTRQVAANGGDISKLNQAGRMAQGSRTAMRAADTAGDAAKVARTAKQIKTGARVARVGMTAGKAALTATGVGAVVVVGAEVATLAGTELLGVELKPIEAGVGGVVGTVDAIKNGEGLRGVGAAWKQQGQTLGQQAKDTGRNFMMTVTNKNQFKINAARTGCKMGNIFRSKANDKTCD